MRRSHGRRTDSSDEQQWKRQPRNCCDNACGSVCRREQCIRGADNPSPRVKPSHSHLHKAKPWQTISLVRMRRSHHRLSLRNMLSDGRGVRTDCRDHQEHDSQSHRHDMRRSKAQLRHETVKRSLDCRHFSPDGYGRSLRHFSGRHC